MSNPKGSSPTGSQNLTVPSPHKRPSFSFSFGSDRRGSVAPPESVNPAPARRGSTSAEDTHEHVVKKTVSAESGIEENDDGRQAPRKKGFDALVSGGAGKPAKDGNKQQHNKKGKTPASEDAAQSIAAEVRTRMASDHPEGVAALASDAKRPDSSAPPKQQSNLKTDIIEHRMSISGLATHLATAIDIKNPSKSQGLTPAEASTRLAKHGPNVLTPPQRSPWYWRFVQCLGNLFNVLLGAAGIGYFVTYIINPVDYFENLYIGCVLVGVAFVNAGIEFYELQKIAAILASFTTLITAQADVVRGGVLATVQARYLVPGDVVVVRAGAKVAADVILFQASDCKVDMSSITGESEPQARYALEMGAPVGTEAGDAVNVVFSGGVVVSGDGFGIVVKTGDATVLGQIAALTKSEKKRRSPLSSEIHRFCHTISVLATLTALVFFFFAVARGRTFNYALTFGIGILVAWIPQGLAVTVTMLLTISGRRMADRSVLVKDLHGVETLGAITLLATDKTGTLTKNEMTVANVFTNGTMWFAGLGGAKDCPVGERPLKVDISGVAQILHMAATCTRAKFDRTDVPLDQRTAVGDATEAGMLRWAAAKLLNIDKLSALYPKVFELPFSSDTKCHLTIHRKGHLAGGLTLHLKGAPEVVWSRCTTIWTEGKAVAISDHDRKKWQAAHVGMCARGHRVLAFAMLQLNGARYPDNWRFEKEKGNFPTTDLTFLGLVSLEDPPKEGVRQAIGTMRRAGIKVVMVTGDHPLTGEAVARKVNIISSEKPTRLSSPADLPLANPTETSSSSVIITGSVVPHLSDSDWLNVLLHDEIVFARTSPTQKLEIVTRGQALGHIIGVTGDGVNDAAALKKADLGIAMNRTGSDVSKEAAGMILLDDHFATIVKGVLEGRLIFWNLKKAIKYSLTHIMAEVLPYLLYVLVPIPQALTSIQILAVDLGFELFITLSFAFEPPEDEDLLMRLPPRRPVSEGSIIATMHARRVQRDARRKVLNGTGASLESGEHGDNEDGENEDGGQRGGSQEGTPLGLAGYTESRMLMNRLVDENAELLMQDIHENTITGSDAADAAALRIRSRWARLLFEVRAVLTQRGYWRAQYRAWRELTQGFIVGERLVDGEVMMWAYLEAGMIEFCGGVATFFAVLWFSFGVSGADAVRAQKGRKYFLPHSPDFELSDGTLLAGDSQFQALKQAQSGFYLSILIIQIWNLFACKARLRLPFGKFMVQNPKTWYAILSGTVVGMFIVYLPFVNSVFLTSWNLDPIFLLIPMVFGGILLLYSIFRKLVIWKVTPEDINPSVERLNMAPSIMALNKTDGPASAAGAAAPKKKKRLPSLGIGRTVNTD
ncbi:hypothetical protein HDU89_002170 [Geranomyces variabilis]|nr:hypothetical protein HDU89_002170 [Geranomyces variabilis]